MHKPGVLVIHNRYRQAGGEDAVVRAEGAVLRAHGHRVTEFARDNRAIERYGVWRKACLGLQATWAPGIYRALRGVIRRERPAVAHCHNLVPLISPAAYYACRDEGVPVVQTLHNFRMVCPAGTMFHDGFPCEDCATGMWRGVGRGCYRQSRAATAAVALMLQAHRRIGTLRRMVDAYSAPSEFCARKVSCDVIPANKITVRSNFLLNDPGARQASGGFVLFAGRLCEEKGVPVLLRALRALPHIPLVIAGDGPLRDEVRKSAGRNMTITGELSQSTLLATMKAARFLVFPTVAYETFGMAILEAAACGVASIGSRLGAVPELVQDGRTGLLFDSGNSDALAERVRWAWSHPVSMNEMGAAARRRYLGHHTAKKGYEGLSSLYGSVSPEWAEAEQEARSRGWQDHSLALSQASA